MNVIANIADSASQDDLLSLLLIDAGRLLRAAFEHRIANPSLGLTAGEARALINIADCEGDRQSDIATRMGVEPMTLCTYLDKLQAMGLVERQTCAADRRAKRVNVTPAGEGMLRSIRNELKVIVAQATAGMEPDDRRRFEQSLALLNRNLQASLPTSSVTHDSR